MITTALRLASIRRIGHRTFPFTAANNGNLLQASSRTVRWAQRYISKENAGNWPCIEIYDLRGNDSERLWFWVNPNLDFT